MRSEVRAGVRTEARPDRLISLILKMTPLNQGGGGVYSIR